MLVEEVSLVKYRRFITASVFFTFAVVGVTGVTFKLFFKTHTLQEIHGWLGLALVVAALGHMTQNWRTLQIYLRDRRVLSLMIPVIPVIAVIVGFAFAPAERPRPNPRALLQQLSQGHVRAVAAAFQQNPEVALRAMEKDGLKISQEDPTVDELARENHRPPEAILQYFAREDGRE